MPRLIPVAYVTRWTSITGALETFLAALGPPRSGVEVSALSGHAFRLAITSTPDGEIGADGPSTFSLARAAALYEGLGWRFASWSVGADDFAYGRRRDDLLKRIRKSIDRGRPAIVFGLHLPEFGVVRGYQGDDLIAATTLSGQYGERIPTSQWPPPGRSFALRVLLPERTVKVDRAEAVTRALGFAVAYARSGEPLPAELAVPGAANGLSAYGRWAAALESDAPISPHGQAYCIQALQAARKDASMFLKAEATLRASGAALQAAAVAYAAEVLALSQLATLFPYPNGGNVLSAGNRRIGAGCVRRAWAAEEEAVAALTEGLTRL